MCKHNNKKCKIRTKKQETMWMYEHSIQQLLHSQTLVAGQLFLSSCLSVP